MNDSIGCMGFLFLLSLCAAGVYHGYLYADSKGIIQHEVETTITARNDWLVGESKACSSETVNYYNVLARKYGGYSLSRSPGIDGDAMSYISCDGGAEHRMKVTFFGRKIQTEHHFVHWDCTRDSAGFTCKETSAQ